MARLAYGDNHDSLAAMNRMITALVALALPLQPLLAAAQPLAPTEESAINAAVT